MRMQIYFVFTGLAVICAVSNAASEESSYPHTIGSPCRIRDWKGSSGICELIQKCGPVLSNLRSGINPTLCKTGTSRTIVCCPNERSKSEIMCDEYLEILRTSAFTATPLLPLDLMEDNVYTESEIKCELFANRLITGGQNAKEEQVPHMVALGWGSDVDSLEFRCGGALISDQFVLTAAHCITSKTIPSYVLLGDIRLKPPFSSRRAIIKIAELIKHPYYRKPIKYNDIALIRLETAVNFSRSVRPACLPQPKLRLEKIHSFSTAGWGKLGQGDTSDILQAVDLTRFGQKECGSFFNNEAERALKYPRGVIRSQVCAGDRGSEKDTCQGDSGGPLTVTTNATLPCVHFIVGVTSFGALYCGFAPGVYTNVQSFLPWIERTVWPNQDI